MPVSVKGIDHVVVRVPDLDTAEALWRRLGFALTPRGFHAGRGSANHTAPFAGGNYVELIHLPAGVSEARFDRRTEGPVAIGADLVSIHTPDAFRRRFPEVPLPAVGSEGWFAGLVFETRSRARVEAVLQHEGVAWHRAPSGDVVVRPADGGGTLIVFREA